MTQGLTAEVAEYVSGLRYDEVPERVVWKVKEVILDQLGCQLSGATLPWSRALKDYIASFRSTGSSTLLCYGTKVHPELAALGNGSFGHGFDMDDLSREGVHHPGAASVSSAVALGEFRNAAGRALITSVYAGWELSARLGLDTEPAMMDRGFHMMGTLGAFGSVFASGKILELKPRIMVNAMGIVGSHASTINRFAIGGGDVKRLHGGIGASVGVRSALLANAGYTGPTEVLEGEKGFCRVFAGAKSTGRMIKGLGRKHYISNVCFKVYSSPAPMHGPIQALLELMAENSLEHSDITEVEVGTSRFAKGHLGSIGPRPGDMLAAQYSFHYGIALSAVRRSNSLRTYSDAGLHDAKVLDLARRVRVVVDEDAERAWPKKMGGRTTVRTRDGREFSKKVDSPKGTPERPLSREELESKFLENATMVMSRQRAERAMNAVWDLEKNGARSLARILVK